MNGQMEKTVAAALRDLLVEQVQQAVLATDVSVTTTRWVVNASGQTDGVHNEHGNPDLIAVIATNHRTGYVNADQLDSTPPRTIRQALADNQAGPRTLTVYESDGKTPIGKFPLGR